MKRTVADAKAYHALQQTKRAIAAAAQEQPKPVVVREESDHDVCESLGLYDFNGPSWSNPD